MPDERADATAVYATRRALSSPAVEEAAAIDCAVADNLGAITTDLAVEIVDAAEEHVKKNQSTRSRSDRAFLRKLIGSLQQCLPRNVKFVLD